MRYLFQITTYIQVEKRILVPLLAGYLLFITAVVMTTPTTAYFTSTTKVEDQMVMSHTFAEEEYAKESGDQDNESQNTEKVEEDQEKQAFKEQKDKRNSSDKETEKGTSSDEGKSEQADSYTDEVEGQSSSNQDSKKQDDEMDSEGPDENEPHND